MVESAKMGADIVTIPPSALRQLFKHPLTDKGLQAFLDDWAKTEDLPTACQVVTAEQILTARKLVDTIYVDDKVKDYIVDLVCATRDPGKYKIPAEGLIELGASPDSRSADFSERRSSSADCADVLVCFGDVRDVRALTAPGTVNAMGLVSASCGVVDKWRATKV